jgi:uncharacterized membrane protein
MVGYRQKSLLARAGFQSLFHTPQKKFHWLGLHKTLERNAILIFVAPRAHKFAVLGDQAIHDRCGEQFWQRVVDRMREHFRSEKFSDALTDAVHDVGGVLAVYFPKHRHA